VVDVTGGSDDDVFHLTLTGMRGHPLTPRILPSSSS
jgi:hypothetical protein